MQRHPVPEHLTLAERYAILRGQYPAQRGEPNMVIKLTDEQIVRVLFLAGTIVKMYQDLPAAPGNADVSMEIAKHLRQDLERNNGLLLELGALLRPESELAAE